jgi:hypothetical protein
MKEIDTSGWTPVGRSANSEYYAVGDHILAAVPNAGSSDTESTARENCAIQNAFFEKRGRGGLVVVFFDRMESQDKGARRVYQTEPDPNYFWGTALVGGSMLGRAMASFFLGLAKPRVPIKMCATLEEAKAWANELAKTGGKAA